ncbi:MAG: DUF3108 domain-containing protein [Deltaproteobacteria bacterium]|nr:DUF3108 domain-containing protein [Deltaproteobacteria bacterium]
MTPPGITPASAEARALVARPGERFTFSVGYLGIIGARARIAVAAGPAGTLEFTGDVENTALLRFVFRVRDRFQSVFSAAEARTVRTQLWQQENSFRRYREEAFFDDRVVTLERRNDNERTQLVATQGRPWDPLAVLFWIRGQRLEVGDAVGAPMFANNRQFEVRAQVTGREAVRAAGRSWPALRLDAHVFRDGKPISGADGTFWVSDDEQRLPLRGEANTGYGRVTAALDKVDR